MLDTESMKSRLIRPEFWIDEKIVSLPPLTRLFFISLWCLVDDEGRMRWKPQSVRLQAFPADPIDPEAEAKALEDHGLIVFYGAEHERVLQVVNFKKHQKLDRRRTSPLPAPPQSLFGIGGEELQPAEVSEIQQVLDLWNTVAQRVGLHTSRGGDHTRRMIRIRLKDRTWFAAYKSALIYVEGSDWCKGGGTRGWVADLNWMLRPGTAERYADRKPERGAPPSAVARPLPRSFGEAGDG